MFLIFLDFPLTLNIKLQETHETIHIISRLKVKTRKDKGEGKGQDTSARDQKIRELKENQYNSDLDLQP